MAVDVAGDRYFTAVWLVGGSVDMDGCWMEAGMEGVGCGGKQKLTCYPACGGAA